MRCLLWATALMVLLTACSGGNGFQAEVLPTPFPGTVLTAHATDGKCHREGCWFEYRVRITNPMDRDANVQRCRLQEPPRFWIPVSSIAGLWIPAHATKMVRARRVLPIERDAARTLIGQRAACEGLDWHGHAPI
jgi:hypothetical protein